MGRREQGRGQREVVGDERAKKQAAKADDASKGEKGSEAARPDKLAAHGHVPCR